MRIGLVGSHGTGKSGLVKTWLSKHPEYYTPPVEESRKVAAKGLGLNFECTQATQEAFMDALGEVIEDIKDKDAITPRTLIDLVAYNLYFFRRKEYGITQEFMDKCRDYTLETSKVWDLFVYCPIMWELKEENEFRKGQKDNPDYQKEIDSYVFSFLVNYNIPFITLTSTNDDERVLQIESALFERIV